MGWLSRQSAIQWVISLAAFCTVWALLFQHQDRKQSRHSSHTTWADTQKDPPTYQLRYRSVWTVNHTAQSIANKHPYTITMEHISTGKNHFKQEQTRNN